MQIYHDHFSGDVNKINGLNHYIGMATINNEMFPEFAIMRYAFYLLIAWGLIAALIGRLGALFSWIMALFAYVIWAMWDMYAWGYKYGHDLDPQPGNGVVVEGGAEGAWRVDVGGLSVEMHRHDCRRPRCDRRGDGVRIDRQSLVVDVGKYRRGARHHDRERAVRR